MGFFIQLETLPGCQHLPACWWDAKPAPDIAMRKKAMPDCVWFAGVNVDLHNVNKALFERLNIDLHRIRSVVAMDHSVMQAFTTESLRAIDIPVTSSI